MLVLARKENERIYIGEEIVITVVRLSPYVATIGIDAPPDVTIRREEVTDDRSRANRQGRESA